MQKMMRAFYLQDITDVIKVPNDKPHQKIEEATEHFYCENPHLSAWVCVAQSVNDMISESRRQAGFSQEDVILREIQKVAAALEAMVEK